MLRGERVLSPVCQASKLTKGTTFLEIDGQPVDAHTNPDDLLQDKVGRGSYHHRQLDREHDGSPKGSGCSQSASEMSLRYTETSSRATERRLLKAIPESRIGYMHVSGYGRAGFDRLREGILSAGR